MSDVNNFIVSDFSDIFEKAPVYNRLLNERYIPSSLINHSNKVVNKRKKSTFFGW